jgi:hypothetical protein
MFWAVKLAARAVNYTYAGDSGPACSDLYCIQDSLRLVADLVESPASNSAYDDIMQRLVASHQLSDFQKAENVFLMQPLGGCKPLEMMAAILEVCREVDKKLTCLPASSWRNLGPAGWSWPQGPQGSGPAGRQVMGPSRWPSGDHDCREAGLQRGRPGGVTPFWWQRPQRCYVVAMTAG